MSYITGYLVSSSFEFMALSSSSDNAASNTTDDDFGQSFLSFTKVAAPLYVLFLLVPSLLLNGFVIFTFIKKKQVRSPLTLLIINQCLIGICSNTLNGLMIFVATPIALRHGNCVTILFATATILWTHYGMHMISLAAISVGIYVTLKYGPSSMTYKRALTTIAVIWIYPALWAAMLTYFVKDSPSLTCEVNTDYKRPASNSTLVPQIYQIVPFLARDFLFSNVSRIIVAVACIGSYRLFRKGTINPGAGVTRRMLLLPILMTVLLTLITASTGMLLIGLNNGYVVTITVDSPIVYIKDIVALLLEYDAIAYASMLIYFNLKIQNTLKETLKEIFGPHLKFLKSKQSKVSPTAVKIVVKSDT